MSGAIFLDRDGTIIEDTGYAYKLEDLKIYPQATEALKLLGNHFLLFIITNQPGIQMGLYTEDEFRKFNIYMLTQLEKSGIKIIETFFCPHISGCDCRKPSTKFIEEIIRKHGVDAKLSWVIGDHPSDIEMGIRAGCRTVYLLTGHGQRHFEELDRGNIRPGFVASDMLVAARGILGLENKDN